MSVLYPVAATAEAALAQPIGRAARESDAAALASGNVEFVSEDVGPAFANQEAALAVYRSRIETGPEERFCALREVIDPAAGRRALRPQKPTYKAGRRWPEPKPAPATLWRLSITYWRVIDQARLVTLAQARQARRSTGAEKLDSKTLRALAQQPLRPLRPQQPLDVGLFEVNPPEAPHILMPDE
ncbi:MAG: hypothetical protein JWO33_319 [Caulobacteraceae bacterium]|nr:hypothetical protein [Caulobacteraceae bacterium]